jgi:alanyl-tRNA synthetase
MLGNFSIGDYFKKEAITYGFELLTRVFEIPPEKLYITVFEEDTETYQT